MNLTNDIETIRDYFKYYNNYTIKKHGYCKVIYNNNNKNKLYTFQVITNYDNHNCAMFSKEFNNLNDILDFTNNFENNYYVIINKRIDLRDYVILKSQYELINKNNEKIQNLFNNNKELVDENIQLFAQKYLYSTYIIHKYGNHAMTISKHGIFKHYYKYNIMKTYLGEIKYNNYIFSMKFDCLKDAVIFARNFNKKYCIDNDQVITIEKYNEKNKLINKMNKLFT